MIRTPHDTFTAAQHINQSIPVRFFMTRENLVTFHIRDFVDDVKEVMARKDSVISRFWATRESL